ncbi:MAG: DNA cytosine methyltransferase [Ruminococcus sp.]|nr:DNA cytosine methyltransferase [Ruminococcus sp.]
MNDKITLGSLFDGSGGFPLAGLLSGVTPVWASEIEPFPIRVTTKRLPFMKHYGNISAMNGAEVEPVDIITFGSPCQDMSVAGRRAGLDGSRSNLFYEAVRIIKEMRCATDGKYPKYVVWENVPGAFSSNKGDDFRCVLESVCQIKDETAVISQPDKWFPAGEIVGDDFSVAWRVLDAQYWGVPQRRKRIFLVADFAGRRAGKILFESEGLSGYSAQSLRSWQETACRVGKGTAASSLCLNDQGGNRMDVSEDVTSTLRAEAHHPPCVMENKEESGAVRTGKYSAGFCTEHSAKSRTIGYEEEKSPTLRAGTVPAAVALDNHPIDSRIKVSENGVFETLTSRMGTGGNNVPLVMKIRSGCEGGGKGPLIQTNKSATLSCNNDQTLFEPKVYGICSKDSNAMKSDNPNSGFYEADTSRTIDGNGGNPSCNQGGMAVVAVQGSMIGRADKNGPQGSGVNEDVSFTLDSVDRHAVAYGIDRAAFNQGINAKYNIAVEEELEPTIVAKGPGAVAEPTYSLGKGTHFTHAGKDVSPTLTATDYKDPPAVNDSSDTAYIVRRLTPTECARLQGFPDWWCSGLGTENPTEEDIAYWRNVFETHRTVTGAASKPKSDKQLIKWITNPHSDSAEYKMWGNGIALPCAVFVLAGIVYFHLGGDPDEL